MIEEGKVTPENTGNENVSISKEQFNALMARIGELESKSGSKIISEPQSVDNALLKQLSDALLRKDNLSVFGDGNKYVSEKDIDPADRLNDEEAVTFFAHKIAYVIVDDLRDGHPVRTPFGRPIILKWQSGKVITKGKEQNIINLSAYTSYSKKEVDWLRKHRLFGVIFFESIKDAINVDHLRAHKIAKYMGNLMNMDGNKLVTTAQRLQLPMETDVHKLRIMLASYYADEDIKKEKVDQQMRNADSIKESMHIKGKELSA